jgi:hypothetical protein
MPVGQTELGLPGRIRRMDGRRTPKALHVRRHARGQKADGGGSRNLNRLGYREATIPTEVSRAERNPEATLCSGIASHEMAAHSALNCRENLPKRMNAQHKRESFAKPSPRLMETFSYLHKDRLETTV